MLILNPRVVKFGASEWPDVTSVVIDRTPDRIAEDWSDGGPFATFADVPRQSVRIRITQEVASDRVDVPRPGERATLSFFASPARADGGRRKVSADAVVLSVEHELSLRKGAIRRVVLAAVSADGAADPIVVTDADGGQT